MAAPIVLFVFKRLNETQRVLEWLSKDALLQESPLYIYCDAARAAHEEEPVNAVRRLVRSRAWCPQLEIVEQERNKGVDRSTIEAVTRLCALHGRVIVVEDDLLLARGFLSYMNRALDHYQEHPQVMEISGYMNPVRGLRGPADAFFLPLYASLGWATWERAWRHFDPAAKGWERLKSDEALRNQYDHDGAFNYSEKFLKWMGRGESVCPWDYRWLWTMFNLRGLTLFPLKSLVRHTGTGPEAEHATRPTPGRDERGWSSERSVQTLPQQVAVNQYNLELLKTFMRRRKCLRYYYGLTFRLKRIVRLVQLGARHRSSLSSSRLLRL